MNLRAEDRQSLIRYRVDKAKSTIEEVTFLIEHNKLIFALNRIYYGNFYALSALALKHNFTTSKHQRLIGWFNKTFVKENQDLQRYGEILRDSFKKRMEGDYKDYVNIKKDEVEKLFAEMKEFIKKIEELI